MKSRIKVGFNSLLIRGEERTILVDPGTGNKQVEDKVIAYKMDWPRKVFSGLSELGVSASEIDTVILTHLHWDHCGGATILNENGKAIPTFPNAKYYLQRRELEIARKANDPDSFLAQDYEPLDSAGVLELLDSDAVEILPGINVRWTGGHTAGHQIVIVGHENEPKSVYLSDLVPTSAQLPIKTGMSYDDNPTQLQEAKQEIIEKSLKNNYLLLFVHAPRIRAGFLGQKHDGNVELKSIEI